MTKDGAEGRVRGLLWQLGTAVQKNTKVPSEIVVGLVQANGHRSGLALRATMFILGKASSGKIGCFLETVQRRKVEETKEVKDVTTN